MTTEKIEKTEIRDYLEVLDDGSKQRLRIECVGGYEAWINANFEKEVDLFDGGTVCLASRDRKAGSSVNIRQIYYLCLFGSQVHTFAVNSDQAAYSLEQELVAVLKDALLVSFAGCMESEERGRRLSDIAANIGEIAARRR